MIEITMHIKIQKKNTQYPWLPSAFQLLKPFLEKTGQRHTPYQSEYCPIHSSTLHSETLYCEVKVSLVEMFL